MGRHSRTILLAWRAGDGYDQRLMAESAAGLYEVVRKYLIATGQFEVTDRHRTAWIGWRVDTFGGHLRRALRGKVLFDFSSGDFWQLLKLRSEVGNYTDDQTLRKIEHVAGDWLYHTTLAPAVVLTADGAISEWWIECPPPAKGDFPSSQLVLTVVTELLRARMATHLNVPLPLLEIDLFDAHGASCSSASIRPACSGSFACRLRGSSGRA